MLETRTHTVRLSRREIVAALKAHYTTSLTVQAIPADGALKIVANDALVTLSWERTQPEVPLGS